MSVLLTLLLCGGAMSAFVGCTPREQTLRLHNWNDYLDKEYVEEHFPAYFAEKTGKKVKIKFSYFDTNEDMLTDVEFRKKDFDLVCPSDYMNERMQKKGLLLPIDKEIVYGDTTPEDIYEGPMNEIVKDLNTKDENGVEHSWMDYALPYMWGTLGILYRGSQVGEGKPIPDESAMTSWDCLFDGKLGKSVFMKDSERDAFAAASIYLKKSELSGLSNGFTDFSDPAYMTLLKELISDEKYIDAAMAELTKQKKSSVYAYEVDKGKQDFVEDKGDATYGLFWSCDAGYAMVDNQNLYYEVPEEGSNVWVDAFVIPKYAKNVEAAQYFLKFLLEEETAMANVLYVGASTPLKKTAADFKAYLEEDEDGFFDGSDDPDKFREMYMRMMFPSDELLSRCAMMRDFGEEGADSLKAKWLDVKNAKV